MDPLKKGVYEQLVHSRLQSLIEALPPDLRHVDAALDPAEAHEYLARYVYDAVRETLARMHKSGKDGLPDQVALCNLLIGELRALAAQSGPAHAGGDICDPARLLTSVHPTGHASTPADRPVVPLSVSSLLINEASHLNVATAVRSELSASDNVDLICAFVNHSGVRIFENELRSLCARGRLRVITTTYMGATQRRALDLLAEWGARIKVAYELPPANTRLHAKAWLFDRGSGFHTALIGSSNISHAALVDGLEWNVHVSNVDAPQIIQAFRSTFERYWADPVFETYDPQRDRVRLDTALRVGKSNETTYAIDCYLDVQPRPHQSEILDALEVDRVRHGKMRNLVVAATGTGKTIIAALDFRREMDRLPDTRLLFVAHRNEILDQSISAFRQVLRDGAFGEKWAGGSRPTEYRHVFASVQTLANLDLATLAPDYYGFVIVDEFHHAEAATYRRLLDHLRPRILLGLTATPERTDGVNVMDFFGGECTVEMRLWDALADGLLCPFQYFGISDNEDLTGVRWDAGAYDVRDLEERYVVHGDGRAALVLHQTQRLVGDIGGMKAIGFCVSIAHAEYMARKFTEAGVPCRAVTSRTGADERAAALRDLKDRRINIVFAVDIYNEGVDIPQVDTVLFLRPTESATVFLQQLGRGLRLYPGKAGLTVLDFVGRHRKEFRLDLRFRAMTGLGRTALTEQVEGGFPVLPPGCVVTLDRVARDEVLRNLREALPSRTPQLVAELRRLARGRADYPLADFLHETGLEPAEIYRGGRSMLDLKARAGLFDRDAVESEVRVGRALRRLLGVEDDERVGFYRDMLLRSDAPHAAALSVRHQRMLYMLAYAVLQDFRKPDLQDALGRLWSTAHVRAEIVELLTVIARRSSQLPRLLAPPTLSGVPLLSHSTYTMTDVVAALGIENPSAMREGVYYAPEHRCDALFVTLRKNEDARYSDTTRYDDYVISPTQFHWESQSTTAERSAAGQRYIRSDNREASVVLFVRENRVVAGETSPYLCAGTVRYVQHESERPMRITWELDRPLPAHVYPALRAAAG